MSVTALDKLSLKMRGVIFRRIITELPYSTWLGPAPIFNSMQPHRFKISAAITSDWRRFYRRSRPLPFVPPTVSELPVPFGCWEKEFKKQNAKSNKHLALGVGFFLFTISVVSQVATFNAYPPPLGGSKEMDDDMCAPPPEEKKCPK